jgi:hypothetical protein
MVSISDTPNGPQIKNSRGLFCEKVGSGIQWDRNQRRYLSMATGGHLLGRLTHSNVLDISPYERYADLISRFKAAINACLGLPPACYLLFLVLFYVQLIGPAFGIGSSDLWDEDSPFTTLVEVFAVFWQGPGGSARVYVGLAFTLVTIALYGLQGGALYAFNRARIIPKRQ